MFVSGFCLHVYLHTTCLPNAPRGQKRATECLDLEYSWLLLMELPRGCWRQNLSYLQEQPVLLIQSDLLSPQLPVLNAENRQRDEQGLHPDSMLSHCIKSLNTPNPNFIDNLMNLSDVFLFVVILLFLFFLHRISLCSPDCPGTPYINQVDHKHTKIHWPLLPKCWD